MVYFIKINKKGSWCSKCANIRNSKTQIKLYDILQKIFPNKVLIYNYRKFNWLKTTKNGKLEIDIYIPHIKLAIEYNGRQHFEPVCFGSVSMKQAKINLKYTKKLDKLKNKKIQQHSEDIKHFLIFNYKEKITEEYIINKLKSYKIIK